MGRETVRQYQVVIPAGGYGSRQPLSRGVPKILLAVHGRSFLNRLAEKLVADGVTRVHFCLGHAADAVRAVLDQGIGGLSISYTVEPRPLGVAGALRLAIEYLEPEFVMVLGDVLPRVSLAQLAISFAKLGPASGLCAARVALGGVDGNVFAEGDLVLRVARSDESLRIKARAAYHDVGISYLHQKDVAALDPDTMYFEQDLFNRLAKDRLLAVVEVHARSFEIGSVAGYTRLSKFVAGQR